MLDVVAMNELAAAAAWSLTQSANHPEAVRRGLSLPFEVQAWRSNGFSDSVILQLQFDSKAYAIRSWPDRFDTPSKVEFWQRTNADFSSVEFSLKEFGSLHDSPFPKLHHWQNVGQPSDALFPFRSKQWTLCDWVEGKPIEGKCVDKTLVCHLATILARMHNSELFHLQASQTESNLLIGQFSSTAYQRMPSNSLRERLEALKLVDYRWFAVVEQNRFFANTSLDDRVKHCLAVIVERGTDWSRFVEICVGQTRHCHWVVRDLWRENILLDESGRFSTIVDLGAARMDWPGLDFIRLFGSLTYGSKDSQNFKQDWSSNLWADAYNTYTAHHPKHSIESLDECKMLHHVSTGLSVLQWVKWIESGVLGLKDPLQHKRVAQRLACLCDQFLDDADLLSK